MKVLGFIKATLFGLFLLANLGVMAQNPIIQSKYTADPAPMVYNDTVFLFVGCDEKDAPENRYLMREYRLYTTTDMVNWTDHGAPLKTSDFSWSRGDASAGQCIERNGKFYFYMSTMNKNIRGVSIGVAVADSPYGPYKDALGKALITNDMTKAAHHSYDDLDPTVFIDDDGQAYLYWGNGVCYWVKLNDDMVSINGDITAYDKNDQAIFGKGFTEAPWVYKHNKLYYMIYASGFPESIHYSTSKYITGPWKYKGVIMPLEKGSNTNHPGIINYKGNAYFFYHNDDLPGGHSYCRSVCVEQFKYNNDGTIPELTMTSGTRKAVATLDPYKRNEAETIARSAGITVEGDKKYGCFVSSIHDSDYIMVRNVDFGVRGGEKFIATTSSRYHGGTIEIRTDSIDGALLGILKTRYTGEWKNWATHSVDVKPVTGIHDLYFVFHGGKPYELFKFDYWQFSELSN